MTKTQSSINALSDKVSAVIKSMLSGMTSNLVHAGGPPIIICFSALGLTPIKFVTTAAIFFALLNVVKLIAALSFGLQPNATIITALLFFSLAMLGNWIRLKIMNYLLLLLGGGYY